ncbi:hypothetical protein BLNAU_11245 [Blattamonas nauphoetae]|uniref:Uncharacterized protein n=1 Tax=Blattamonas nauphoetae TaxID=2049346 RepID=A0ABQ9XN60_9EUKA|nr:hypothetical protein BLNAU_11245 [Blattamonas nauphoetae]
MLDTSTPMTVPTAHGMFHHGLIWVVHNLMLDPDDLAEDKDNQKRIQKLRFERVLKPAKQYLLFIVQREEFIPKDDSDNMDTPTIISLLSERTLELERDLFEDGEIVETGREEWEVGWLVEKTKEDELGERLKRIREDDVRMRMDEERWKKTDVRRREAGHEDALEGWLMRMDNTTRSEIEDYIESVSMERGMNLTM